MPEAATEHIPWSTLAWRKSRHSNPSGECVELAQLADGRVAFRNSREPDGVKLVYSQADLAEFITRAKRGAYDELLS